MIVSDWRLDAACQGQEHVFWGDDTVMTAPSTGTARAVCARCPVMHSWLAQPAAWNRMALPAPAISHPARKGI